MCYLFLLWKPNGTISKNAIIKHFHTSQIFNNPEHSSINGYGIAGLHKETHRWKIYHSVHLYKDDPLFSEMLDSFSKYSFLIGHVRENPVSGSHGSIENTHPFHYRNHLFFQKGTNFALYNPQRRATVIRKIHPTLRNNIIGTTDTELLFYLFLTNVEKVRGSFSRTDITSLPTSHFLYNIYQSDVTHYRDLYILYYALMHTIEYLHNYFRKASCSIIYTNKKYTMVLYVKTKPNDTKFAHIEKLYWNVPNIIESTGKPRELIISAYEMHSSQIRVPDNSLLFIENSTGKLFPTKISIS